MIIDFQNSYLNWETKEGSFGRFNAEALCDLNNEEWILGSEVIACNVYSKGGIINEPSYSFQPLFSKSECKIFRTYLENNRSDDTVFSPSYLFKQHSVVVKKTKEYSLVNTSADFGLTQPCQCIVKTKDYSLQFPVRHLNFKENGDEFQVETGPIAFPYEGELYKGFIAFNTLTAFEVLAYTVENGTRNTRRVTNKNCEIKIVRKL